MYKIQLGDVIEHSLFSPLIVLVCNCLATKVLLGKLSVGDHRVA